MIIQNLLALLNEDNDSNELLQNGYRDDLFVIPATWLEEHLTSFPIQIEQDHCLYKNLQIKYNKILYIQRNK